MWLRKQVRERMPPLLIKICGITTKEVFDTVAECGADFAGFVFFPGSPRNVPVKESRKFKDRYSGKTKKVAVTVNANDALLSEIVNSLAPDVIQLHGDEDGERICEVRELFKLPVIKTLPIFYKNDLVQASSFNKYAKYLLFDSNSYSEYGQPSWTSEPFNWEWLKGYDYPYFVAGGLTPDNIASAVYATWPYCSGVDVSSGVEDTPGVKSTSKIREFVHRAREAVLSTIDGSTRKKAFG